MESSTRGDASPEQGGFTCVRQGEVLTITMNRPEVRNAMRPSTWKALASVGRDVPDDVRVVVVRGEGPSFCSGVDVRLARGASVGEDAPLTDLVKGTYKTWDEAAQEFQQGFTWLRDRRFVSVAVVQGHAIGAGMQLALACDLRVAGDDAIFCVREPALGLVPDLTGTATLVATVGYSRALEWSATARFVGAEEALHAGLVAKVAAADELDDVVADLVRQLRAHPREAVVATKGLLLGAAERAFQQQLPFERAEQFRRLTALAADL